MKSVKAIKYKDGKVYLNGEAVEIDKDGNVVIEGALTLGDEDQSVKKIYCHPISIIKRTGDQQYCLSCFIFNNDSTPFTFSTFKDFIDNLYETLGGTVRICMSGYYKDTTYYGAVSILYKASTSTYGLCLGNADTPSAYNVTSWGLLLGTPLEFTDGVNAIN